MLKNATSMGWNAKRSADLYQVDRWGKGFFSVESNGHLHVCPTKDPSIKVDLTKILDEAAQRGCEAPVLIRFPQIAQRRLGDIQAAFATAIKECSFQGKYTCVYPIKVNQHLSVVEAMLSAPECEESSSTGVGLEAGSKAELLAIIPCARPGTTILCNGFKDVAYIEMALRARRLGLDVHIIIEKPTEFRLAVEVGRRLGIEPKLGVRVKLAARGSGHWEATGGHKSKFGLTVTELLAGIQQLRDWGKEQCVQLLHFHLGSQIPNIRRLKAAVIEATRIYADLKASGIPLSTIDVGGGLGVDYSGMRNNSSSSMNYSLQEYANDVVYYIHSVCQQADVPAPNIFSESGRALVAHHSLLVFPVFGSTSYQPGYETPNYREMEFNTSVQPLVDLMHALNDLNETTMRESYHDAQASLEMAINLFNSGFLSLADRAMAETLYREVCRKVSRLMMDLDYLPHELENLQVQLAEIYYGNFSLFRSLPDHWAIGQLFPVMPIHKLDQRPSQKAILSDITCDSDGKLSRFISTQNERATLPLHPIDGSPYYIGVFLAGAYQEILGADHNLMGDTHVAQVAVAEDGSFDLQLTRGEHLADVLSEVGHYSSAMTSKIQSKIDGASDLGALTADEAIEYSQFFEDTLNSYCYLDLTEEGEMCPRAANADHQKMVKA
jgi:arginine decarboxylase